MYEELFHALALKVPDLVVFLILVYVFMRAQKNMVGEFVKYMHDKDADFERIVEDNSEVLRENTKVLGAALHVLEDQLDNNG